MGRLTITTPPIDEPISVAEAQAHLRVDSDDDAGLIQGLITAAREYCEETQGRSYVTRTYEYTVEPVRSIDLPMPNHLTVESVTAILSDGTSEELTSGDDYEVYVQLASDQARVRMLNYPAETEALVIEYTAGYGTPQDVPQRIKQAMLMLIGHWYEHRQTAEHGSQVREIPYAATALLMLDTVEWGL